MIEPRFGPPPERPDSFYLEKGRQLAELIRAEIRRNNVGNCTITVHLTGSHHNKKNPKDANRMAAAFVARLKEAGHNVEAASFTYGGRDDIADPSTLHHYALTYDSNPPEDPE